MLDFPFLLQYIQNLKIGGKMALAYKFVPGYSAIIAKVTGSLSLKDILDFLAAVAADPRVTSDHVTFFDATEVTGLDLSPADIMTIAAYTRANSSKVVAQKLAIVARGDEETKLAEQYEKLASAYGESTIVFYHKDVACKWLGIPLDI
jgi:hypothetical protein